MHACMCMHVTEMSKFNGFHRTIHLRMVLQDSFTPPVTSSQLGIESMSLIAIIVLPKTKISTLKNEHVLSYVKLWQTFL